MKPIVVACVGLLALAPLAVLGQERTPPAGSTSSGSAAPRGGESGGSSGGSMSSGGGSSSSGSWHGGGGSGWDSGRTGSGNYGGVRGGGNRPGGDYRAPAAVDRTARSGESFAAPREARGTASVGQPVPAGMRPRGDNPTYGQAVPRGSVQPKPEQPVYYTPGYYGAYEPYTYGGLWWNGAPYGYWSGYYNPYWSNPFYRFALYNPWSFFYDDEWFTPAASGYYSRADQGSIRFKVKQKDAEVWVDGYFEGPVSGYDGMFQGLKLASGRHRIEIKAKGYETLSFEVRVMPGRTVTYTGDLKPVAVK